MRANTMMILLAACLAGCSEAPGGEEPAGATRAQRPFADAQVTDAVMGQWARSCALCHVSGEAGAPRMGIAEEWEPRLAQGETILLAHTIEGFNDMPPLGYCMACERDDFRALIKLMAGDGP